MILKRFCKIFIINSRLIFYMLKTENYKCIVQETTVANNDYASLLAITFSSKFL
jgi:hypothetical protein